MLGPEAKGAARKKLCYQFEGFELSSADRSLTRDGRAVPVGQRALEILLALVESAGKLVTREHLQERAWPNSLVEENTLRVHISALRRLLAEAHVGVSPITTVTGRGYIFAVRVTHRLEEPAPVPARVVGDALSKIPPRPGRLVGRDGLVGWLVELMPQRRFQTLVGPGGMGKTAVAIAVGHGVSGAYADGVFFVDLAPLANPLLLSGAVAGAIGLQAGADCPVADLLALLATRHMLIILDNCEHLIDAAAGLAEQIYQAAPEVHLLATSREALRVQGEVVHRLPPLALPAPHAGLTALEALGSPAVQLFVERATNSLDSFVLTDALAPAVAEICVALDGIPLAIQLVASRVVWLGVQGVAAALHGDFLLRSEGFRTSAPRQRTLSATLRWSYDLLECDERAVLARLAAFQGEFTLEAAANVAGCGQIPPARISRILGQLMAKSLLSAEADDDGILYRLPGVTRAYAAEKLEDAGDRQAVRHRHAVYLRDLLRPVVDVVPSAHRRLLGDVRAALDWSFAPDGDPEIGVALVLASEPLWSALPLAEEGRGWVERALAEIPDLSADQETRLQSLLDTAFFASSEPFRRVSFDGAVALADHCTVLRHTAGVLPKAREKTRVR